LATTFDGTNQYIIIDTDTTLDLAAIYSDAREWEDDNLIDHHVFDVSSELLFTLRYGWKFKPSGYSAGTVLTINGKLTTTEGDGEVKTVPATTGSQVTWQFDTPATAVIVTTGSGLSSAQDALLTQIGLDAKMAKLNTY